MKSRLLTALSRLDNPATYLWILWAVVACSPADKLLISTCEVPPDQTGTFIGKWDQLPIHLFFDEKSFSKSDSEEIHKSVSRWNTLASAVVKKPAFQLDAQLINSTSTPTCDELQDPDCTFTNSQVVLFKVKIWTYGISALGIAMPLSISTPADSVGISKRIFSGAIALNFDQYFSDSRNGDTGYSLQAVVVHELGHILGLAHSCEHHSLISGMPDCDLKTTSQQYLSAMMFPGLSHFSYPTINRNDQGRANCLYNGIEKQPNLRAPFAIR